MLPSSPAPGLARAQGALEIAEGVIAPRLVWPGSVIDDIARKIVLPCAHDVIERLLLDVDECRQMRAGHGDAAMGQAVDLGGDFLRGEDVLSGGLVNRARRCTRP